MHRKFIALIVATAIAITGFSAAPARAGEAEKILGGLAAIALFGAAVHHYEKKKKRDRVARQNNHYQPVAPRPLPPRISRYDLPAQCLKQMRGYPGNQPLLKPKCLQKHYTHANSLPQFCRISFWNGQRNKQAYEPRCLRQQGYRVVHNQY